MYYKDIFEQIAVTQARLMDSSSTASNWSTGISNDYRSYNPANSKYASVAITRASVINPQRSFANLYGPSNYSSRSHWLANSAQVANATANRISYLAPLASRPNTYYFGQQHNYMDPTKASFANQIAYGLSFYRFSDGNKIAMDQMMSDNLQWLFYNENTLDSNLLTLSSSGMISKIEAATNVQDNSNTPSNPLLFQTHGGMPADTTSTWRTDYARDAHWQADNRDTYIWYRPDFGSNKQIPENIETMGEWYSNATGGRSGS